MLHFSTRSLSSPSAVGMSPAGDDERTNERTPLFY